MQTKPELTIQVPVGVGTHIGGGCFFSFHCTEVENGELCGESEGAEDDRRECFDPNYIEDVLSDELHSGEPIAIESVSRSNAIAIIELPVVRGISVFNADEDISGEEILESEDKHQRASKCLDGGATYAF